MVAVLWRCRCGRLFLGGGGGGAVWPHGCSGRRRARPPARLGVLTSFGAAPRSPPVPSGPSGALHTVGAGSLMCALRVDSLSGQAPPPSTGTAARPRHHPRVPQPGPASKPGHALRSLRRPSRRRCLWFWCTRAPKPMGAQTGSGERNIAPAWCSSSWNGASLKQKPPTHAHNRRKLAYLGVLGRIIFHGVP